jgi:glucuronokinase
MTWHTTIPRSVGLAGSSALVIGALRAVAGGWDVTLADDDGPRRAHEVEADLRGIAAGPQDRIVQWHGSTVLMDFGRDPWRVEPVQPPSPLDLFVCWTDAGRRSSDATHAPLQQRRDDPDVRTRMAALAGLAHEAAAAVRAGDVATLGTCLDAGFRLRRELVPLEPAHVALVDALRALGAAVNYTGSGGAVVALAPAVEPLERWAAAQRLGWCTTRLG